MAAFDVGNDRHAQAAQSVDDGVVLVHVRAIRGIRPSNENGGRRFEEARQAHPVERSAHLVRVRVGRFDVYDERISGGAGEFGRPAERRSGQVSQSLDASADEPAPHAHVSRAVEPHPIGFLGKLELCNLGKRLVKNVTFAVFVGSVLSERGSPGKRNDVHPADEAFRHRERRVKEVVSVHGGDAGIQGERQKKG